MRRPPVAVHDVNGSRVASITVASYKASKRPKSTRRKLLEIVALLALWKLGAWLLFGLLALGVC